MKTNINKLISKIKGIFSICIIILLFGGLYSCDDFLEREPLDSISDAAVWVDISLVEAYVNYTYSLLHAGWYACSWLDISSDDGYGTEKPSAHLIQRGEVTASNVGYLRYPWSWYWSQITYCNRFHANVAGENLDALKSQDKDKINRMIGEMKFIRAYAYFRLLAFYGGVPLIKEPFILGEDFMVARNSYDEVLAFVINELDEAATLLPLSYSGDDLGRITKGAALAIKARALLYAASPLWNPGNDVSKWQKAADAAKAVIDLNLYSLHPDYKETFTEAGNFNEEIIWAYITNQGLKYSAEYRIERKMFPNGSQGWGHPSPSQNLVDCYETTNGLLPKDDPSYDAQDPWVNRDPRFYASILYDGAPFQGREIEVFLPGGADSPQGNEGWNASWTGYYIRKYIDESILVPTNYDTSNPNWPYARYGEVLLNYAEAQFYLGNEDLTREYLNKIRSRPSVMMPDVTDTGADLEKRIRNERRIELYCEEHRFFDMRRWKIAPLDSMYRINVYKDPVTGIKTKWITGFMVLNLPERMYLTPIPQSEIDKNPNLEQNPGY
jgi:hypothetical protein